MTNTISALTKRMRLYHLRANYDATTDSVEFTGGASGTHKIYCVSRDPKRVVAHWNGYAANNGLKIAVGRVVCFNAGIGRVERIMKVRKNGLAVQVSIRYKNGNVGKPRWIEISKLL